MKNVLICYFSGTGNTKKVIDEFVKHFEKRGINVTLFDIKDGKHFDIELDEFDLVGIAYPVHAFNAPANILTFAKLLKEKLKSRSDKIKMFIMNTSGEPLALNNVSSLKIRSILRKKADFVNEFHYCMPYNIIFRHSDNMAFKMWDFAQKAIPVDCEDIIGGKRNKPHYVFMGHFLAWLFRIEHWGGRFNGKRYKVSDACIKCGFCVKNCPTNNIKIENGEFVFGKNCLMCMRCSFLCQKAAIKIGLFEKWKVNGRYNFNNFNPDEKETHKKYCKKAYVKYFSQERYKQPDQTLEEVAEPDKIR